MLRTVCATVMLLPLASAIPAQSGSASFNVPRHSVDGGATSASSAYFDLTGTLGQPEASAPATSTTYALSGGFHRPAQAIVDSVFSDGFEVP